MPRIELPNGSEIVVANDNGQPAFRRRKFFEARKKTGEDRRQHFESSVKRVVRGVWDYVTGDGDDWDRAQRMLGFREGSDDVSGRSDD